MTENFLKKALELAELRRGFCAPNPAVGAVIVKDGQLLSSGYHWAAGSPHAEVEALSVLGEEARGATLYTTLEPCCVWGRTPPCTQLIIERGLGEVYYGYEDPNPDVAGKGAARLREAGVKCEHLVIGAVDRFYDSYRHWCETGQPWVTAKLAMSFDGKIAGEGGVPVAISGQGLNCLTHKHRKHSDALLTTAQTVLHDNPSLNVRLAEGELAKPLYILDSHLSLPLTARIFQTTERLTVFHLSLATSELKQGLEARGVKCVPVSPGLGGLDLNEVVDKIGADGVQDLWVEAGGACLRSLVELGLVRRAYFYFSPKWLGEKAHSAFGPGEDLFSRASYCEWRPYGRDAICEVRW